jgi:Concanavalin A-like lectin/glucanases superfamily/Lectin C-type domain
LQRFKFSTWEAKAIIQSDKIWLMTTDYKTRTFEIYNGDDYYSFNFTEATHISYIYWNSICITYDYTDFLIKLFINGKTLQAFNEVESPHTEIFNVSESPIILGDYDWPNYGYVRLTGEVTDLNFWSHPLTTDQVKQFSGECSSNLMKELKPEYIEWSNVNITFQSDNTQTGSVSLNKFCITISQTIVIPYQIPYKTALQTCRQLGGEMPMPNDNTTLMALLETLPNSETNDSCSDKKFWLPALRSGVTWIHDTSVLPGNQIEIQAGLLRSNQRPQNCMVLDVEGKTLEEKSCSEGFCSLCCIHEEKLKFNINALCIMDAEIDTSYFLTNEPNLEIEFQGILGLSTIAKPHYGENWMLFLSNDTSQIFMSTDLSQMPTGKKSWSMVKAGQDCLKTSVVVSNKMNITFSNVSQSLNKKDL